MYDAHKAMRLGHNTLYALKSDTTYIHQRSQTSLSPRIMASSAMGLNLVVFRFLPTTHTQKKRKTNAITILEHHAAFCSCLSSRSVPSTYRYHTHLMNHGYLDYKKNLKTPKFSLMLGSRWDQDGTRSWVSVYI